MRFLLKHPDKKTKAWAEKLLDRSKRLFFAWHRRDEMTEVGFHRSMITHRDRFLEMVRKPPDSKEASEQQIRHCVIDRRITQGTRSAAGQRYHERMWTAIATCGKQGRSFFHFLHESIEAQLNGHSASSLLKN